MNLAQEMLCRGVSVTRVSAFSSLDEPGQRPFVLEVAKSRLLPVLCGTYALYDRAGDLLYIGKAKNLRPRVRSHLRDSSPRLLLPPWGRLIAEIEVRPAQSELEALLVEAHLMGRLRPPFNRQMRSWSRYCYLVQTDDPSHPLSISTQLPSWRRCFGPYRSRRQAVAIIEGVFRVIAHRNGNARSLTRCYELLAGKDDSLAIDLERQCQMNDEDDNGDPWTRVLPQVAATLRKAFERAALLREAEQMLGGIILLPGPSDGRTVAVISERGLHINTVEPTAPSAEHFLERYSDLVARRANGGDHRLPKTISDCLCVAARGMKRHAIQCRFLPMERACRLSVSELLAFAFGDKSTCTECGERA